MEEECHKVDEEGVHGSIGMLWAGLGIDKKGYKNKWKWEFVLFETEGRLLVWK